MNRVPLPKCGLSRRAVAAASINAIGASVLPALMSACDKNDSQKENSGPMANVLRVVAIGDSLIYGRNDAEEGGWINRLRKHLETTNAANVLYTLGVIGETSTDLTRRFQAEIQLRTPNRIIVAVGTNDVRRIGLNGALITSVDDFRRNLKRLLGQCGQAKVALATPLGVDEARTAPRRSALGDLYFRYEDLRNLREVVREVANEADCLLLDLWGVLDMSRPELSNDGIHPTTLGHEHLLHVALTQLSPTFLRAD